MYGINTEVKRFTPGGFSLMALIPDKALNEAQHNLYQASEHLTIILNMLELLNQAEFLDNSAFEDLHTMLGQSHYLKDNIHKLQDLLVPGQPLAAIAANQSLPYSL
jgi:hypothetical protein